MIRVRRFNDSRSQRLIWLPERPGLPYAARLRPAGLVRSGHPIWHRLCHLAQACPTRLFKSLREGAR